MAHKDIVVKGVSVEYEGVFDFQDLFKYLKTWLKRRGYNTGEEGYKEIKGNEREVEIAFGAQKKIDDYVKFVLDIPIELKNLKEVKEKGSKKILNKGKLAIEFKGYLNKDYENKWDKNPVLLFWREVYDKWVIGSRIEQMEKELKSDVEKMVLEIKAYLKLMKF